MAEGKKWALVDAEGFLIDVVEGSDRDAALAARALGALQVVFDNSWDYTPGSGITDAQRLAAGVDLPQVANEARETKVKPEKAPHAAMTAIIGGRDAKDLVVTKEQILGLGEGPAGLVAAHALLFPYFADLRLTKTGELPIHWTRPVGMARNLLRQNYKTEKTRPSGATSVMGLSFLPQKYWSERLGGRYTEQRGKHRERVVNLCVNASDECREACLIFSGRNQADVYNDQLKAATMEAWLNEPVAFGRMLYEACVLHRGDSPGRFKPKTVYSQMTGERRKEVPFIRLNVLSDVPWELLFPDLFSMLKGLSFYDYTKVPGRVTPSNYDLTFSWSGDNLDLVQWTLDKGGKVAVVFFKRRQKGGRWSTHSKWRKVGGDFPKRFMGATVLDGDVSDVRPFDSKLAKGKRKPYIIALRYKPPKGQAFDPYQSLFVVPVYETKDGEIIAAQVPRDTPGTLEEVMLRASELTAMALGPSAPGVVPLERIRREAARRAVARRKKTGPKKNGLL